MNHIHLGNQGEDIAANYLGTHGYRILARKYRSKSGEIDIIAKSSGVIVFVEVKTRRTKTYGSPAEAVGYHKQRKIMNTALNYLMETRNTNAPLRFDVLEVFLPSQDIVECNHIINAFGR